MKGVAMQGLEPVVQGATWIGISAFVFKTVQWLCNFLAGRHDARVARVTEMEKAIDAKIAGRLKGLESELEAMQLALDRTYLAASILVVELSVIDPNNKKNEQVRLLMNRGFRLSRQDVDAQFDELLGRLS